MKRRWSKIAAQVSLLGVLFSTRKFWYGLLAASFLIFSQTTAHGAGTPGTLKWSHATTGNTIQASPAIGADGTIYVGSYGDKLYTKFYAINPNGTLKWSYATGSSIFSSPAIGTDGTIYVGSLDGSLYAIYSSSPGLATSPWPMFHHDLQHTGRLATPISESVTIDIEPWFKPNIINLKFKWAPIPVAILSKTGFDATKMIDEDSLTFGDDGNENSLAFCSPLFIDVNGDRLRDLICFFYTGKMGFLCGDTKGTLQGKTKDGKPIEGSDLVKIVPCK
jgi:hypothetical protein